MIKRWDREQGKKVELQVALSELIIRRLNDFCTEQGIEPSTVVERALEEYFHMGDIGH